MNRGIAKLYNISRKDNRLILGLMSGTSLDGLDIALCRINGTGQATRLQLLQFETVPYTERFRSYIKEVFAKRQIDQQRLSSIHAFIGATHARLVNKTLNNWNIANNEIDLIASHGQTVYHAPQVLTKDYSFPNSTLQIGDADHIALQTGIITISDFRQKHVAAGGEGAPLAVYGDYLLFRHDTENRILLNIGGISNFTFLPHSQQSLSAFATDIGPGNTMMNQYVSSNLGLEMDVDAKLANEGTIHEELLTALLEEAFLSAAFPKTTGPELFNLAYLTQIQQKTGTTQLSIEDTLATLNMFSAKAIAGAILAVCQQIDNVVIYISGGGLHNPLLIKNIKGNLPNIPIRPMSALGMNPDAKEACLFALLANETVAGNPENVEGIAGSPAICMGKISFPY